MCVSLAVRIEPCIRGCNLCSCLDSQAGLAILEGLLLLGFGYLFQFDWVSAGEYKNTTSMKTEVPVQCAVLLVTVERYHMFAYHPFTYTADSKQRMVEHAVADHGPSGHGFLWILPLDVHEDGE